jgi:tRNA nucleotidyltransferase (CCA-adding enzyme)
MISLPNSLGPVIEQLIACGARPVLVGGYVRDALLGITSKDIDIEVYCVKDLETLQKELEPFGRVSIVGKSFGILKLSLGTHDIDFALPRTERKKGAGHKGFHVSLNSLMDFASAARRRDFTVNAMGYDLNAGLLLDPYGGEKDLKDRILRCVDPETFVEDPLRIFRAVQMAPRFGLVCDPALLKLCRNMVGSGLVEELPKERIFEEIKKLLLKAQSPSEGFRLMESMALLDFFPELKALKGVGQEPRYHPEGDVWTHTLLCLDAMAGLRSGHERRDLVLMLATLCHDFGKAAATQEDEGHFPAKGHEAEGVLPTERFLRRLSDEQRLFDAVVPLVKEHHRPLLFYKEGASDGDIRRLATRVSIKDLLLVAKADFLGRTTEAALSGRFPAGEWLKKEAERIGVFEHAPEPLLQGRDLIELGLTPSKTFKTILGAAFDAQLEGVFSTHDEGMIWLKKHVNERV